LLSFKKRKHQVFLFYYRVSKIFWSWHLRAIKTTIPFIREVGKKPVTSYEFVAKKKSFFNSDYNINWALVSRSFRIATFIRVHSCWSEATKHYAWKYGQWRSGQFYNLPDRLFS